MNDMNDMNDTKELKGKLEALRTAYLQASQEKEKLNAKIRERQLQLQAEAAKTLAIEFNDESRNVKQKCDAALQALKEVEGEVNRLDSLEKMPYPDGTILCQWITVGFSQLYRPTGAKAVIQVFKNGDSCPENMKYGCPNIGDIVFRFLNKDGKPGKKIEVVSKYSLSWGEIILKHWLPEGVNHPNAGEPWKI